LFACVALVLSVLLALPAEAGAITAVERAQRERRQAAREVAQLRRFLRAETRAHRDRVSLAELVRFRGGNALDDARWAKIVQTTQRHSRRQSVSLVRLRRRVDHRVDVLTRRRDSLAGWLERVAIFRVCPVEGFTHIYDDFGEMVRLPKVPVHRHMGSDITAPVGAPIRAPFDGYATSSSSPLGGLQVTVRGALGSVFNAHLSGLGRLGYVRAGTVIGYVGATGDATAPHDHIEWHPGHGGAVDPYPLLAMACLPV
jgi:murein DD-endopeptidase MepM/ murein hydrolase activator NlpD